jgi:hypothetical protein
MGFKAAGPTPGPSERAIPGRAAVKKINISVAPIAFTFICGLLQVSNAAKCKAKASVSIFSQYVSLATIFVNIG